MEQLLIRYGIFAVFFGSMVEGDAMPVMSGLVAHLGYFRLWEALVASIGGMFIGDCLWYWLGRGFGPKIEKTKFYQKHLPKAERFVGKIGIWQILAARVVYGTRNVTMLFWGVKKLNFVEFAAIDLLGCLLWGAILALLGYFLSFSAEKIIGDIKEFEFGVLLLIILVIILILLIKFIKNKRFGEKI